MVEGRVHVVFETRSILRMIIRTWMKSKLCEWIMHNERTLSLMGFRRSKDILPEGENVSSQWDKRGRERAKGKEAMFRNEVDLFGFGWDIVGP